MSEAERKVPKLRFPGFTEDWEQRKLGEISEKVLEKNQNMQYRETFTNSAELGIISQIDFFDKEISNKENISGYYVVRENDFIYNPRISNLAPVGPINRNKLNKTGVMSPLYTIFNVKNIDLDFLENFFQSKHWHKYMKLNGDSGARADRIAIKDAVFFEMPILIPKNIQEQILIGKTINNFNKYITLHQRKLENLKLKKKALLQKLFPKNGEQFPELRFPGFTDAWEQRKLGEIVKVYDNLRVPIAESDRILGNTPYYGANGIQGYIDGYTHNGEFILIAEDGANDLENYPIRYVSGKVWVNNHAHVVSGLEDTISTKFLGYSLKRSDIKSYIVGGSRSKLNLSDMLKVEVSYPKLGEQTQIHRIMDKIDAIITLHQRKLEHLQLQKKALLQQMFV